MTMPRCIALASGLLALMLAVGCGKRGPLYLPGEKDQAEPASQETSEPYEATPDSSDN